MKRIWAVLLTFALCISALATGVFAANDTTVATGSCGDGVTWTLSADCRLTLSGSGAVTSAPWQQSYAGGPAYAVGITSITVGEGVTALCDGAFSNCPNLTQVLFYGDAPTGSSCLAGLTAATKVWYPTDRAWTAADRDALGANGAVTWKPYCMGDANLDGKLSVADALILANNIADKYELDPGLQSYVADLVVNEDDAKPVNVLDLTKLMARLVGKTA